MGLCGTEFWTEFLPSAREGGQTGRKNENHPEKIQRFFTQPDVSVQFHSINHGVMNEGALWQTYNQHTQ